MRSPFLFASVLFLNACHFPHDQTSHVKIINGSIVSPKLNDSRRLSTVSLTAPSILRASNPEDRSLCTGTVIGPRLVLTAAHCLDIDLPQDFGIAFGTPTPTLQSFIRAEKISIHQQFSYPNINNDIALIYLSQSIDLPYQAALLPISPAQNDEKLWIVGYGNNVGTANRGNGVLRQAEVRIVDLGRDQETPRFSIHGNDQANTCYGDSGGPAYGRGVNGFYQVFGITSYGLTDDCSDGWDTDVYSFINWIHETARREFDPQIEIGNDTKDFGQAWMSYRNMGMGKVEFNLNVPNADEIEVTVNGLNRPLLPNRLQGEKARFAYTFLNSGNRTLGISGYKAGKKIAEKSIPFKVNP